MRSVAVAVAGLFVVLLPSAASADGDQRITHYAESIQLETDGAAHVSLDLSLDFADVPGHGPYLTIPVREATDDGRVRVYEVDGFTASSSSGAPADVSVEDDGDSVVVRIGDPAIGDVDGVQKYHVEYDVGGLVDTDATTGDGDQLYWDPIGPDWELPLSDVRVEVSGPGAAERARCFAGAEGSTASCSSAGVTADGATFSQESLEPGEPLTVVAGWPAGTFPGAHAVFESDDTSDEGSWTDDAPPGDVTLDENGNPVFADESDDFMSDGGFDTAFTGASIVIGLGFVGVIVAIIVAVVRGSSGRMSPPADVMSLAARGYVRMDPIAPDGTRGRPNWMLVPLRPMDDTMTARERAWYGAMFVGGMVPVYWSNVHPPADLARNHSFSGSSFGGSGGGFGGGAGAGGGGGGGGAGGGGSW